MAGAFQDERDPPNSSGAFAEPAPLKRSTFFPIAEERGGPHQKGGYVFAWPQVAIDAGNAIARGFTAPYDTRDEAIQQRTRDAFDATVVGGPGTIGYAAKAFGALPKNALTSGGGSVLKEPGAFTSSREIVGGFYSPSLEAAKALRQKKGTVEQMRAQLLKAGAKEKELAATGFDRQFSDPAASVTQADIEDYLRKNRVNVRRQAIGDGINDDDIYTAEEKYRDRLYEDGDLKEYVDEETGETVLEAWGNEYFRGDPEVESRAYDMAQENMYEAAMEGFRTADPRDVGADWSPQYKDYFPGGFDQYYENLIHLDDPNLTFSGSHWGSPSVLAHTRAGDFRDAGTTAGNINARYLGEVQSDWAQRGRKKGFKTADDAEIARLEAAKQQAEDARRAHVSSGLYINNPSLVDKPIALKATPDNPQQFRDLVNIENDFETLAGGIPQEQARIAGLTSRISRLEDENRSGVAVDGTKLTPEMIQDNNEIIEISRAKLEQARADLKNLEDEAASVRQRWLDEASKFERIEDPDDWLEMRRRLTLQAREADGAFAAARSGIAPAPFVQNTDDWVDLALKASLIDAAEDSVDRLYLPTGDAVRSYTYGGADGQGAFYGGPGEKGIVPMRMQKLLQKTFGKKGAPEMKLSEKGENVIDESRRRLQDMFEDDPTLQFPYFDITPEMRQRIKDEGLPLFMRVPPVGAFGVPREEPIQDPDREIY